MEQKKKSIGTTVYLVTQMDAISALKIQTKLMKLLGPGTEGLKGIKVEKTSDLIKALPEILPAMMKDFNDELVNEIILALFDKGVFIEKAVPGTDPIPEVIDFSTHFTGKLAEMWKVAAFIMEVNFSLGELFASISPIIKKEKSTQEDIT
jgi:hypothetical protein